MQKMNSKLILSCFSFLFISVHYSTYEEQIIIDKTAATKELMELTDAAEVGQMFSQVIAQ
jgi:hypothetical protein